MEETDYVDICNFIQSDPNKRRWPSTLDKKNKRNFRQKCSKYEFISGTVHYKHPKRGNLRVIRESEKETILHACHKAPTAGHFGVVKTTKTITERYYWPRISKDIQDYIGCCEECQSNNHLRKFPGELHPIPPPDASFQQFGLDLVGPFHESENGNRYIAVLTDYLTKWPEAEAIKDKKASTIAEFLVKVICRYSSIEVLITDQGREFCNSLNDEICQRLGIDHRRTSAYHPQSNGLTERFNQTLITSLVKYTNEEQTNWDNYIQPALLAYRTAEQKSTKQTPFFLAFGRKPSILIEQQFPVGHERECGDSFQDSLDLRVSTAAQMLHVHSDAKEKIETAQKGQKKYYDKRREPPTYRVGDKVLINNPKRINRKGDKLVRRWKGPYEIIQVGKKGTFQLKDMKCIVNASRMKPFQQRKSKKELKGKHSKTFTDQAQQKEMVEQNTTVEQNTYQPKDVNTTPPSHVKRKRVISSLQPEKTSKCSSETPHHQLHKRFKRRSLLSRNKLRQETSKQKMSRSTKMCDVEITKVEKAEKLMFMPISEDWQKRRAAALGCKVKRVIASSKARTVSVLEPPSGSVDIRGDGNCFFRTISHVVTGDQDSHLLIREKICHYERLNNKIVSNFAQQENYLATSKMAVSGTWATEVEILATASMLATNICVYSPYGIDSAKNKVYKWLTYRPLYGLNPVNGLRLARKTIYITNVSDHYAPVYDISK